LVASDQAYAGGALQAGIDYLSPYSDAPLYGLFVPPFSALFQSYVVDTMFENPRTGFKAVIFRNDAEREVIVALAGTDGADLKDWWGNLTHYAWNQWQENRLPVLQRLDSLSLELRKDGAPEPAIHFTGQSLGGALAQYATYEF